MLLVVEVEGVVVVPCCCGGVVIGGGGGDGGFGIGSGGRDNPSGM